MRRLTGLLCLLMMLGVYTGCTAEQGENNKKDMTFFAMDTVMEFHIDKVDDKILEEAKEKVLRWEKAFSTTDENSEIYAVNQEGEGKVSKDTAKLIEKTLELCKQTDGALDISIYPIVQEWGFTTGDYKVPEEKTIQTLLQRIGFDRIQLHGNKLILKDGMKIDLGSVAKGFTADQLTEFFKSKGITSGILNLGGNVQAIGKKENGESWNIAIQNPKGEDALAVVSVSDCAVVTSGIYERYFTDEFCNVYWHIMNPSTGYPAKNGLASVTIITPSGLYADALSTAMFVKGMEDATEFWRENQNFEMVCITTDQQVFITEGLENNFSFTEPYAHLPVSIIYK